MVGKRGADYLYKVFHCECLTILKLLMNLSSGIASRNIMVCRIYLFYFLVIGLLASACSNESTTSTKTELTKISADSSVVQAETMEKKSAGPHKAQRGKPGADVSLTANVIHRLEPGEDGDVVVELSAPHQDGEMTVTLAASEGLHIVDGGLNYTFALSGENSYNLPLRVMATEAGRYYIHLQVVVTQQGRQRARALAVIVQVGPESVINNRLQKADSSEAVIPLPAQESIIQK